MRYAIVSSSHSRESIEAYLPSNYHVVHEDANGQGTLIAGEDDHGWGLDSYVIPRFGSGLISCREVVPVFMNEQLNMGPGYCMDIPNDWLKVPMPQSVRTEARQRNESNLVQIILAHEACDDLERNGEYDWTFSLNPDFFFAGDEDAAEFGGTLEYISEMIDSDALRRVKP